MKLGALLRRTQLEAGPTPAATPSGDTTSPTPTGGLPVGVLERSTDAEELVASFRAPAPRVAEVPAPRPTPRAGPGPRIGLRDVPVVVLPLDQMPPKFADMSPADLAAIGVRVEHTDRQTTIGGSR